MKKNYLIYISLFLLIFFGVILSFDKTRHKLIYSFFRFWDGDTLVYKCYEVKLPVGWVKHSHQDKNGNTIYILRNYDENLENYVFLSIVPDFEHKLLVSSKLKIQTYHTPEGDDYLMHEMPGVSNGMDNIYFYKVKTLPFYISSDNQDRIINFMKSSKESSSKEMINRTCK